MIIGIMSWSENGLLAPGRIAEALLTTKADLARSVELSRDAVTRADLIARPATQRRLREMVAFINRVAPRLGSALLAYAWYRSEPLAGFASLTPMQLLKLGRAADVLAMIDGVDAGVHV